MTTSRGDSGLFVPFLIGVGAWIAMALCALFYITCAGCSMGDLPSPDIRVGWETDCAAPDPSVTEYVEQGLRMWDTFGANAELVDDAADSDVTLCRRDSAIDGHYSGWYAHSPPRMELDASVGPPLALVVAHELGHHLLPYHDDRDHLPDGQRGIMSHAIAGHTWSNADIAWITAHGFWYTAPTEDWYYPRAAVPAPVEDSGFGGGVRP